MAVNPITSESLTVDYKSLMKIPIADRVKAATSVDTFAQSILTALTPIEIAKAFPDYYRRQLPDISNFLAASRYLDGGGTPHQTGGGEQGYTPAGKYDGETKPGGKRPAGTPEPTVAEMKKKLLEKGVDVDNTYANAKNGILEGDKRFSYLKKMSDEDLKKSGLQRVQDENGKTLIKAVPSEYEAMTKEQVLEEYKKEFPATSFSPRERATLDLIAKREGSKDPNIIFGDVGGKPGSGQYSQQLKAMGYTKPLTEMTIAEVRALQKDLIKLTKGRIGKGDLGTSAVGSGQMIGTTLEDNLKALGIPQDQWDKIKFSKELQEKLTLSNFKLMGIGDPNADPSTWNHTALGEQYESFNTSKFPPMTPQEAESIRNKSNVRPELTENITPEEAITKLNEVKNNIYKDEFTRMMYDKPSTTSSEYIQAPFDDRNVTVLHGQSDTFTSRSNPGVIAAGIDNIDPRLVTLGDAAIRAFEKMNPGYTVRVISGKRTEATNSGSSKSRHLRGGAVDYEIVDPDGNVLPNLGGGKSGVRAEAGFYAPKYEEFGRYMEAARVNLAKDDPRYNENQVVSGLHFGGTWWMDSMHMQLGGQGALGNLYSGFKSPDQLRKEGQPEVIVQAVENAIKAGANKSVNEEEMQQLSDFLYNEGKAPIEVIEKVNPVVAEKLQKEIENKEKTSEQVAASTPPVPAEEPKLALGGNLYGLNEDLTLVDNETGEAVAQVGKNEKLVKQGTTMQVTSTDRLKAEELSQKYDTNEMETRLENIESDVEDYRTQQMQKRDVPRPAAPTAAPVDNSWRESLAMRHYDESPSYRRAMNRVRGRPETGPNQYDHFTKATIASKV